MQNKRQMIFGILAICFAAALWGVDGVVLRPSLYQIDVSLVVFFEHALAFAFMFVFLLLEIKELKKLDIKDWGAFFWVALFGGALGTFAITKALFYVGFIPLSIPILLQKLQPVFAIVIAMIVLKEKPHKDFYFYASLALVGSYFVTFGFSRPEFVLENKTLIAALLGLLAAFSWGSSTVFGRRALKKTNFRVATYIRFGLTSIIMLVVVLFTGGFSKMDSLSQPAEHAVLSFSPWIILLIIVFSSGGLSLLVYYYGLKRVTASKATIYELAMPLTAIVLDYLINGKFLNVGQIMGAVILLFALNRIVSTKIDSPIVKSQK